MKLTHASRLSSIASKYAKPAKVKTHMAQVVNNFIHGKLREEIMAAVKNHRTGVNVAVPTEAYDDLALFYTIAIIELKALGYSAKDSHDGGGMYNTLGVSWENWEK